MNTEFITKYYIKDQLISAIKGAKKGYIYAPDRDLIELVGMLRYMRGINTISKESSDKILRLITLIRRKYNIH